MTKRRIRPTHSRVVSATEAARNLGEILARVREKRMVYIVERHGKPVAQIAPVEDRVFTGRDFVALVRSGRVPSAGPEYARAVEEGIALFNRVEVLKSTWEP
ncbi:MAG: type II toxin-antitoxin system Phd/YefM family antitoxin [Gemmatimonadota bacterium]|nr:type II toxin-antitoxin system Phd/YefM family antitoxin [Gemmatimonadota bacterium]MDE2871903.1 type II toxin-antitoxin system Phd/YefM family antitoxin [Gemmatimonadota bacterium]